MSNASDVPAAQVATHERWCDSQQHDALARDLDGTGEASYCVGRSIEAGDVGGWLRQPGRRARFVLDDGGFLHSPVELDALGLRALLRLTAPETVDDLRAVLAQALADAEGTDHAADAADLAAID